MKRVTELDPALFEYLHPYQREGVRGIEEKNGRALLADAPGLGKTIQAIAWLALRPEVRPAIVVCPAIAKHHWRNQAEIWLPDDDIIQLNGMQPEKIKLASKNSIIIINYDILANNKIEVDGNFCLLHHQSIGTIYAKKKMQFEIPFSGWIDELTEINAAVLLMDEVHKVKNNSAGRTQAVKKIARKNVPYLICISGTPIDNRPSEFYNTINWINHSLFPSQWNFNMRYCGPKHNGFGWQFKGASNAKELHDLLVNTIMIRRTKKDVYSQLPAKTRQIIPLDITNRAEYIRADRAFTDYLKNQGKDATTANYLTKLEALKQIMLAGKLKEAIKWIEDFLEAGEKLVIFCEHKSGVAELMKKFSSVAVKVVGGVPDKEREKAEKEFQTNDKIRLFVGNIKAAGVSLTLTASSHVAFLEFPKTPGDMTQCEDRVYGRINDPHGANIYFLVALNTKEEDIAKMLDTKAEMLSQVLDGKDVEEGSILMELINKWKKEN